MHEFRIVGLGMLMASVSCTDDRQVVGVGTGTAGGLTSLSGGQTGTEPGAVETSGGTGSGLGGTHATGGAGGAGVATSGGNPAGNSGGTGSGLGGTQATGGAAGGTIADETCTAPPVQLVLSTAATSSYCTQSCGGFVSILTSDLQLVTSLNQDPCVSPPLCSTCSVPICTDRFCGLALMSSGSVQTSWQGEYYEQDTCGQNVACLHKRCVTSGHFIARFCVTTATSSGTCDSSSQRPLPCKR
jgi:hypothetical protein